VQTGTGWMIVRASSLEAFLAAVQTVAHLSHGEDANRKRLEELGGRLPQTGTQTWLGKCIKC
jgi:hypothetical protein